MIQRIQTVWLALGTGVCGYGAATAEAAPGEATWIDQASLAAFDLAAVLAVLGIFLYKNRASQRKVILGAQYVVLAGLAVMGYGLSQVLGAVALDAVPVSVWIIMGLAAAGFVFFRLARRGVEADIKLLKSVDRLR